MPLYNLTTFLFAGSNSSELGPKLQ